MKAKVIDAIARAGTGVLNKELIQLIKENINAGTSPADSFIAAHKLLDTPIHKNTSALIDILKKVNKKNVSYGDLRKERTNKVQIHLDALYGTIDRESPVEYRKIVADSNRASKAFQDTDKLLNVLYDLD